MDAKIDAQPQGLPPKPLRPLPLTDLSNQSTFVQSGFSPRTPFPTEIDITSPASFKTAKPRPRSVYTLSRGSFSSQLDLLTALQIPDGDSLAGRVSSLGAANLAIPALLNAGRQIERWISNASEIIENLDSNDDVEWAAAAGRDGLVEVEGALLKSEALICAYVSSIEKLQNRHDISLVSADDLRNAVSQMELVIEEWTSVRAMLQNIKQQVEVAMEWEELWNVVLGDIQKEREELSRLVFEMEEHRHKPAVIAHSAVANIAFRDIENFMGQDRALDPPASSKTQVVTNPYSLDDGALVQNDSGLLALFARMQPLKASLDFLPMRLSVFEVRAQQSFPTACEELRNRRASLDVAYNKLEEDAECLRKELSEDRWILVFSGAVRQAQKMYESVARSLIKVEDGIDSRLDLTNEAVMSKRIENFVGKKLHYGPAIERILTIIDKGLQERLTVNGQILRLHRDIQTRWHALRRKVEDLDTVISALDRKDLFARGNVADTTSPANAGSFSSSRPSSPISIHEIHYQPATALKHLSHTPSNHPSPRHSAALPLSKIPRRAVSSPGSRMSYSTPINLANPQSSTPDHKPRWNTSTNTNDLAIGPKYSDSPNLSNLKNLTCSSNGSPRFSKFDKSKLPSPMHHASTQSPSLSSSDSCLDSLHGEIDSIISKEGYKLPLSSVSHLDASPRLSGPTRRLTGPDTSPKIIVPRLPSQTIRSKPRAAAQNPRWRG